MLPGTFGVFETFRILIPGFLFSVYTSWYIYLFFPSRARSYLQESGLSGMTFVAIGLVAGLVLYLRYWPRDSHETIEQLPSTHLRKKAEIVGIKISPRDAKEIYFYILNNHYPDAFRERVFYYGNIYRVAQKIWLVSIAFACLGIISQALIAAFRLGVLEWYARSTFVVVLLAVFSLLRWRPEHHYQEILSGQRKWLYMQDKLVESIIRNHGPSS